MYYLLMTFSTTFYNMKTENICIQLFLISNFFGVLIVCFFKIAKSLRYWIKGTHEQPFFSKSCCRFSIGFMSGL